MNILMDTHIYYWYVNQDNSLPENIKQQLDIAENLFVSAASCIEMMWLVNKGRIKFNIPYLQWFDIVLSHTDIQFIDISPSIAHLSANLPEHHKDPMDRLIIATASQLNCHLASLDSKFILYETLQDKLIYQ